jgi:transcription antitermination factor NusG
MTAKEWFAVQSKPRHERSVNTMLLTKGFETLLPEYLAKRKWSDRMQVVRMPLFPGYLFCRFDPHCRGEILNVLGVRRIVKAGRELAPIDPAEIDALRAVVHHGLNAEPWPKIEIGQTVSIDSGPLAGCTGVIKELGSALQLVVSVRLLQRSILVEIKREWLAIPVCPERTNWARPKHLQEQMPKEREHQ